MTSFHPRGVNHLAIATCQMKAQLTFFAEVLGCPTRALYWMHGVPDALHGFVELGPDSYLAFVQHPDNRPEPVWGVSHAGTSGSPVTAGAMQHVALHVDTLDEVLAMRDRIRANGVQVWGPIDHGFCQSMYFAGPEGLSLEICCGSSIPAEQWIDPEVRQLCGISAEEMARLVDPELFHRPAAAVPQPATDPTRPRMRYPDAVYEPMMTMPDSEVWERFSQPTPPVPPRPGTHRAATGT